MFLSIFFLHFFPPLTVLLVFFSLIFYLCSLLYLSLILDFSHFSLFFLFTYSMLAYLPSSMFVPYLIVFLCRSFNPTKKISNFPHSFSTRLPLFHYYFFSFLLFTPFIISFFPFFLQHSFHSNLSRLSVFIPISLIPFTY